MSPQTICEHCKDVVCEMFGIERKQMNQYDRHEPLCYHRQLAMCLSYELSGLSSGAVAGRFGRDDHGTVLHARKRVKEECRNPDRRAIYMNLKNLVKEKCGR